MSIHELDREYYYYNEPIGYGSFSTIFKGYSYTNCNKPVAIKKITKIIDKKYFDLEVKVMKYINHPNILQIYKVIKKNDTIFLVLEYCNGGDLSNYIATKNNIFDKRYFRQILKGLEYLYNNKILHRDIKPQNILIHNHNIKISDFGFAKSFEKNDLITTFCGSPLYMAPEIMRNREYNFKSDIWSLGVVLYELIVKEHPYYCNNRNELMGLVKNNNFKIDFTKIHNTTKQKFIKKLLNSNPNKRLTWNKIFIKQINDKEQLYNGGEEEDAYLDSIHNTSQSMLIPKKKYNNSIAMSVSHIYKEDSMFKDYSDCKIFSRSAPNSLGQSYMENYLAKQEDTLHSTDKHSMPVVGNSPDLKPLGFTDYLDKSIGAVKGWFY